MNNDSGNTLSDVERELARGLSHALTDDYAVATAHFARGQDLLPEGHGRLRNSLAAFIAGHGRYRLAERELHEASRRFAAVAAEQQRHLTDIQEAFAAQPSHPSTVDRTAGEQSNEPHGLVGATNNRQGLPPLRISCFGRFAVWRGQDPLALCQNRNGQAVLRYLASQPRHRATMDELIEAFWPADPPEAARHKLHCACSALRRALNSGCAGPKEAGYLVYADGSYALNPAVAISIDSDDFQEDFRVGNRAEGDAAIAAFESACRLQTGTFLPDDLYADWSALRREQLTRMLLTMCAAIAAHHLERGRPDRAIDWAQRILAEDRCDEGAHRLLMRAHALCGNRAEAIRQYERCKATLADQIGVAPSRPTTQLFRAILHGESLERDRDEA